MSCFVSFVFFFLCFLMLLLLFQITNYNLSLLVCLKHKQPAAHLNSLLYHRKQQYSTLTNIKHNHKFGPRLITCRQFSFFQLKQHSHSSNNKTKTNSLLSVCNIKLNFTFTFMPTTTTTNTTITTQSPQFYFVMCQKSELKQKFFVG